MFKIKLPLILLIMIFFSGLSQCLAQSKKSEDNLNTNNKAWAIREYSRQLDVDNNKIFLDFEDVSYYNLRRKILKNTMYGLYKDNLVAEVKTDKINEKLDKFQANKKKLELKDLKDYNEARKNLNDLINFLNNETKYDSDGLRKNIYWPTDGRIIVDYGEHKSSKYNSLIFENGIKIKNDFGEDVRAVEKGIVRYADWLFGYGKIIIIDHGKSFYSIYAYLSEIKVEINSKIKKGYVIGKIGESGTIFGTCLYLEIREKNKALNPNDWIQTKKE